jgi:hypothetical protein
MEAGVVSTLREVWGVCAFPRVRIELGLILVKG